jgi:regulator of nucleoside diphosphate kinase
MLEKIMDTTITLTEKDYLRIKNVLSHYQTETSEDLEIEIERATIIDESKVPADLVTMNSQVRVLNVQDDKDMILTLVYPKDASSGENRVSILAPMGVALIGLKVGQEINWMFPDGKTKTLRVLEVIYQPEKNGDWHL